MNPRKKHTTPVLEERRLELVPASPAQLRDLREMIEHTDMPSEGVLILGDEEDCDIN